MDTTLLDGHTLVCLRFSRWWSFDSRDHYPIFAGRSNSGPPLYVGAVRVDERWYFSTVEEGEDEMPTTTPAKPLPIGHRLLPSIVIESEIGQVDKHVLKNVPRVEKFIQDVIRKTVEDELVFPNFHTLILGD